MEPTATPNSSIKYVTGDATIPEGDGKKIIAHICNDAGGWGSGFVVAVSARWTEPEKKYRKWHKAGPPDFELGQVQLVNVEIDKLWVLNMVAQVGYDMSDGPPIRYEALRSCLKKLATVAKSLRASVHLPRIGCGLAGGNWDLVGPIVEQELAGLDVIVYDFG